MPAPTEPVVNNKNHDDEWELTTVVLQKSSKRQGFGIAISGGRDNPHFKTGDMSILVTDIIKGSAADGTLRIGDKLISVNDKLVEGGSHQDAVLALKAAGMQARMQIKRPAPKKQKIIEPASPDESAVEGSVKGSIRSDNEPGRERKRPKEMEQESERGRSRRSRSRNKDNEDENGERPRHRSRSKEQSEKGENGEEKPRRHRSKSREKGEDAEEKPRRHRSKSRDKGDDAEEKPRRHRSKSRDKGEETEERPRRHRSKSRDKGEESEEKPRLHRSKSRDKVEESEEKPRRHRSKSRDKVEDGEEKRHRHRSKSRDRQENGEEEKPRAHRSKSRDGEKRRSSKSKDKDVGQVETVEEVPPTVEEAHVVETPPEPEPEPEPVVVVEAPVVEAASPPIEIPHTQSVQEIEPRITSTSDEGDEKPASGEKKRRSRSRGREREEKPEEPRSRSRGRDRGEEKHEEPRAGRSRSRGRSRDALTRSKSKESLHRSKSKSRDQLSPGSELVTVVLERGNQGYGFSLGQEIYVRDMANDSPAAKADNFEKGDVVYEINGTRVDNLKVSECLEIIRAATEQLTVTVIKKPREIKPVEEAVKEAKPEKKRKHRPTEAPEAKHAPVAEVKEDVVEEVENVPVEATPEYQEPPRESTPPPEPKADFNETSDSWAQASPKVEPTQEMEHMDAKLERLKAGRRFEARMSQLPNARVISFHKTGSVGIQVAGGNSLGVFVAAIRDDSPAAKEGLKPGDQILMCNEIDFEDITREEAVLILLALPDDVSLVVESKKDTFDQIKKELGDNFFIRVNFDHSEKTNQNELTFRKGEIFNVRDTMYQGLIGYWQAQRVGKNVQMLERGVLPNKSRAEQLAIAQKMEDRQASMPGRNKVKRRPSLSSTLKKHRFVSQDRLDESSFADSVQIPAYERVVLKIADFMRPVVILGALGDLVRLKLLDEMPDRFDVPTPMDLGGGTDTSSYGDAIKISEIRNVIVKNKHCLLDITPEGIEMLMYAQLCPIVILLKSTSRGAVKEMRASLVTEIKNSPTGANGFDGDPATAKQVKKVFSNAKKLEEFYPHIFTAKINTHIAGTDAVSREFYYKLKELIFAQQAQSAWMPEEKPQEMLEDVLFHPPNYASYLSGADSDSEGEGMTSSPVLAKKHYEEEEEVEVQSPPSPVNDESYLSPPDSGREREKSKDQTREKSKDRTREKSRDRTREKSRDRTREKSKDRSREKSRDRRHDGEEDKEHRKHRKSKRKPEDEALDSPDSPAKVVHDVSPALQAEPSIGELEELISASVEIEVEHEPEPEDFIHHEDHPPTINGYADDYHEKPPSPRSYRDPPSISQEESQDEEGEWGRGEPEPAEDIPVLRDPNYSLPRPVPDSPKTVRTPESKVPLNSIKVMPSELGNVNSLEEKRKSLKHVPVPDEEPEFSEINGLENAPSPKFEEPDLPPSRPPPPPEKEEVPTKILTLKERMSKLQSKVGAPTSPVAAPPLPPPPVEEPAPPARPAAPRNYINDMGHRGGPKKDLYAHNIVTPSPEFPEITRIEKPVTEEPIINAITSNLESTPNEPQPSEDEPIVLATARGMFDHRGGLLESVETNVSIFIPYGALPEGKKEEIYFKVCQDSKHMPPLDSHSGETLLSPLVMCGPHGLKFQKPIELRLPHKGASSDSMAFSLKSSDSPVGHPGDWRNVKLGDSDLDGGRAYQVTDDTVSVLVDHF